jgi:hypothetical protein
MNSYPEPWMLVREFLHSKAGQSGGWRVRKIATFFGDAASSVLFRSQPREATTRNIPSEEV